MRLFSIIQWHHFAYMVISLALLGYGVSGSAVFVFQKVLLPRYRAMYISAVALFGATALTGFLIAQSIPFNAEEILWDLQQTWYLLTVFLLLSVPFLFAASAICMSFIAFKDSIARIYSMDLLGAGSGSLGIIFLLYIVFPLDALILITIGGLLAALIAVWELKLAKRSLLTLLILVMVFLVWFIKPLLVLNISPYKGLPQVLQVTGTEVVAQRSSPLGQLAVIESIRIPLRYAPGLSLNSSSEPLPQLGVYIDGESATVLTQATNDRSNLDYLDQVSWALPYHLSSVGKVLIVGAGGGTDILQAQYNNVKDIHAVELNPQIIRLVQQDYGDYTGHLYDQDNVKVHIAEVRDYLSANQNRYNLIQLALVDGFIASTSGVHALNESYLYTVEAIQSYLKHLEPGGYLVLSRWVKLPPRDALKLFATAVVALRESGVENPAQRLVLIRSWQTSTLLIKQGDFNLEELKSVRRFTDQRSFDIAYAPDMSLEEANRYNILSSPIFHHAASAILSDQQAQFMQQYKFNLQPATDDRPFFNHFFKWTTLPEIIQLKGRGGMPLVEWGYLVLVATLTIALLLGFLLIVVPLTFVHRDQHANRSIAYWRVVLYFFTVGMAFLFIEIALIQKFIQFLHYPIYSIAVVLTSVLLFAGIGSLVSGYLPSRYGFKRAIVLPVLGVVVLSIGYLLFLQELFIEYASVSTAAKIMISVALISPLAFCMGMPFPLALNSVSQYDKSLVAWAWGINGWASVISAVLATLLAVHFGFSVVIIISMLLYLMLIVLFPYTKTAKISLNL